MPIQPLFPIFVPADFSLDPTPSHEVLGQDAKDHEVSHPSLQ